MKHIQDHNFHDGKILSVHISDKDVEVLFEKWSCTQIKLYFEDYYRIIDNHSIGVMVGELLINSSKKAVDEVIKFIVDDGGSEEIALGLNSYAFTDLFGELVFLEIVARDVRVEDHI